MNLPKMRIIVPMALMMLFSVLHIQQSFSQTLSATINESSRTVSMSNGIIDVSINSKGQVNAVKYKGQSLLDNGGRFYFSYNEAEYHELSPDQLKVVRQTDEIVDVTYINTSGPLRVEQTFVLTQGASGLYSYVVVKSEKKPVTVRELRVVHRVNPTMFDYAYTSDQTQGDMVSVSALSNSTEVMDATYQLQDGSIYNKYNWANYIDQDLMHGLIASSQNIGVWVVPVSTEYINGGPMKQELTVHGTSKTPLSLMMMQGEHFGSSSQTFDVGEGKMYGPYFIYFNQSTSKNAAIADAKAEAQNQQALWPFSWMEHSEYPTQRRTVSGKIKMVNGEDVNQTMVVLAQPGSDIYNQGKEYIFWSKTDAKGNFSIPNVRGGTYSLYAFATQGTVSGQFQQDGIAVISSDKDLGTIEWKTENPNLLLWNVGKSDRKATEFNLGDGWRAYGLWDNVPSDLVFTIGESSERNDWYYAQTKKGSWKVRFEIDSTVTMTGKAKLTVAVAGAASSPKVSILLNRKSVGQLSLGNDASVYRSANTGGKYQLYSFDVPVSDLRLGTNELVFTLTSVGNRGGIMYDMIKLEADGEKQEPEEPVVILNNEDETNSLNIFPNPVMQTEKLMVEFIAQNPGLTCVELFDLSGHLLSYKEVKVNKIGKTSVQFPVDNVSKGIYLLRVRENHSTGISQKLIIE